MNLGEMRTMARRRLLQPTSGGEWSDSELNVLINEAYRQTQQMVLEADPKAIIEEATTSWVAGQKTYAWPADMVYDLEIAIKNSDTGEYEEIGGPMPLDEARKRSSGDPKFHRYGQFLYIAPAPATTVVDGIRLTYVPLLGLSEDTSVPVIRNHWHILVVINAQILALGETSDQAAPAIAERNALYAQLLGTGRRETGGKPVPMSVGIRRTYGRGSTNTAR